MLRCGSSSLGMAFGGGLHRQTCSGSRCGAALLWIPNFGGFLCKMLIPEHGVQPALSPRPGLVTSANCKPVSPLDDAAKTPRTPPRPGTGFVGSSSAAWLWGANTPLFWGLCQEEGSSTLSCNNTQAVSPPKCFIFHCTADPGAPNGFLPLNYFTRSIYLQAVCQRPFKL